MLCYISPFSRYLSKFPNSAQLVGLKNQKNNDIVKTTSLFGGANFDLVGDSLQIISRRFNNTNDEHQSVLANRGLSRQGNHFAPWTYLPGTLDEVKSINNELTKAGWSCRLKTGSEAVEEALFAMSGNQAPEILHIATHGFYLPPLKNKVEAEGFGDNNSYQFAANPLQRSGIILTGANNKWVFDKEIPNTENGVVTALEISNLDFTKTSIVVLSACQTGLGDVESGEGVYGLQRAFCLAGIEKMIVSLWSVPAEETSQMMQLFYSNLAGGRSNYYEAFRGAQKKMLELYPDDPSKWADFKLIGQ